MSVHECCVVCAEPLEWTGIGVCGHTETCSRCIARWRFVLKDQKCMICKTDQPSIFFTRYMGDYTQRLTPDQFNGLKDRANRGELYFLPDITGYFDDQTHFQQIKALCGYTHPFITDKCKAAGREVPVFASITGMKKFVDMHYKMNFCDICLQSRQVFLCEQLLYNKADLDKHMRSGDDTGPLADTSFKGHPLCKFCRKRFYDSNELYRHMESGHEHCFICRRDNPSQYTYFRHYEELEEHFTNAHHPCPHPSCREKKFVVFAQEHELKRHFANEHGDELKMSRAQRREALAIPINVQYRGGEAAAADAALQALSRPGVVIGGGDHITGRHGRGGGRGGRGGGGGGGGSAGPSGYDAGFSVSDEPPPSSVSFTPEDFPSVQGGGQGMLPMTGRWGGAIPGMDGAAGSSGGPSGGFEEHFPALPSMSKAAKKKLRQQQAAAAAAANGGGGSSGSSALVNTLRAANMPIRIINRPTNRPPPQQPAAAVSAMPAMQAEEEDLSRESSGAIPEPTAPAYRPPGAATLAAIAGAGGRVSPSLGMQSATPPSAEDFPSLPAAPARRSAAPPPGPAPVRYASSLSRPSSTPNLINTAAAAAAPQEPVLQPDDFPSLAPTSNARGASAKGARGRGGAPAARPPSADQYRVAAGSPPPAGAASAASSSSSASPTPASGGPNVSAKLQQANRELIAKIQTQLGDEEKFAGFKRDSQGFLRGDLSPDDYHSHVVDLGLLALVPELAALCPVADRRDALIAAHTAYLDSPAAQQPRAGWVPPEAAAAAAAAAAQRASWSCPRCTLTNAPDSTRCEVCGGGRPGAPAEAFPPLRSSTPTTSSASTRTNTTRNAASAVPSSPGPSRTTATNSNTSASTGVNSNAGTSQQGTEAAGSSSAAGPAAGGGKKKGKGGVKITIGLGAGLGQAGLPMGQGHTASKGVWNSAGGAKLAQKHHALNDAWGGQ